MAKSESPDSEDASSDSKSTGPTPEELKKETNASRKRHAQSENLEIAERKQLLKQAQEHHEQLVKLRKRFSSWMLWVVIGWQFFVLGLIAVSGANLLTISDSVLIALVTTTTTNVLGLLIIVLKFVFPTPSV